MKGRFFLETYGCQMNVAESNALILRMEGEGWMQAERPEEADLIILNTCAVRESAEERIHGRIGYYKHLKESRNFQLVVSGCMAQRLGEALQKRGSPVDLVLGTFEKSNIIPLLEHIDKHGSSLSAVDSSKPFTFESLHLGKGEFKAFLPIMHGCNNYCSYCIVPYVRGREISRNPEEIYREVGRLKEGGIKELSLLGQNVNSYRWKGGGNEGGIHFPQLLREISNRLSDSWIRFTSSHPKDFSDELIDVIAEKDGICKHIHLPVQNGSDKVLQGMNRSYTRKNYLDLVDKMKKRIPGLSLSTDIMVGFPGEGEEDFRLTLELIREVGFSDAFTYYFNPREGTKAAEMEFQLPEEVKLERLSRLIEEQKRIASTLRGQRLGTRCKVLVEQEAKKGKGELLARTELNEMVVFPGSPEQIGSFSYLTLTTLSGTTFRGEETCPGK